MIKNDYEIVSSIYEDDDVYLTMFQDTLSTYYENNIKECLMRAVTMPMSEFRYKFTEDELRSILFQLNDSRMSDLRVSDVCQLISEHITSVCSDFVIDNKEYNEVVIKCDLDMIRNKNKLFTVYKEFKANKYHFELIKLTDLIENNILEEQYGITTSSPDIGDIIYDSVSNEMFLISSTNGRKIYCIHFNGKEFKTLVASYDIIKNCKLVVRKIG